MPKAKANAPKPMTAEQWAALNFEPWTHKEDEWKPPTDEEWGIVGCR
jgi:hypothetical protein